MCHFFCASVCSCIGTVGKKCILNAFLKMEMNTDSGDCTVLCSRL